MSTRLTVDVAGTLLVCCTAVDTITLADHRRGDFVRFVGAIRGVDEIMECHHATGGYDYLLKFVTRNVSHYQSAMEGLLERDIGIEKYFSYVIINSPIARTLSSRDALCEGEACSKRRSSMRWQLRSSLSGAPTCCLKAVTWTMTHGPQSR
jgi:hypothetical protein